MVTHTNQTMITVAAIGIICYPQMLKTSSLVIVYYIYRGIGGWLWMVNPKDWVKWLVVPCVKHCPNISL